jgi:hypothetical protein
VYSRAGCCARVEEQGYPNLDRQGVKLPLQAHLSYKPGTESPIMAKPKSKTAMARAALKTASIWDGVADKPHIVAATVANQLQHEARWPPNDVTKIMGSDYHYDQFTLLNFLNAVRWHLANGTPSYTFTFTGDFVVKALTVSVGTLMVAINASTT